MNRAVLLQMLLINTFLFFLGPLYAQPHVTIKLTPQTEGAVNGRDGSGYGDDGSDAPRAKASSPTNDVEIKISRIKDNNDIFVFEVTEFTAGEKNKLKTDSYKFERKGENFLLLDTKGQVGTAGGRGGHGADGRRGSDGSDASRYSSGTDGGDGGDGGDAGSGADGAKGGKAGKVTILVNENDLEALGILHQSEGAFSGLVPGGLGGTAGNHGTPGSGGPGGDGGSSYSWTESESYTDSNGNTQTRTTYHSNSGGSDGSRGSSGSRPNTPLSAGEQGESAPFVIQVAMNNKEIRYYESGMYQPEVTEIELQSIDVPEKSGPSISLERGEKVFLKKLVVSNKGKMDSPSGGMIISIKLESGSSFVVHGNDILVESVNAGSSKTFVFDKSKPAILYGEASSNDNIRPSGHDPAPEKYEFKLTPNIVRPFASGTISVNGNLIFPISYDQQMLGAIYPNESFTIVSYIKGKELQNLATRKIHFSITAASGDQASLNNTHFDIVGYADHQGNILPSAPNNKFSINPLAATAKDVDPNKWYPMTMKLKINAEGQKVLDQLAEQKIEVVDLEFKVKVEIDRVGAASEVENRSKTSIQAPSRVQVVSPKLENKTSIESALASVGEKVVVFFDEKLGVGKELKYLKGLATASGMGFYAISLSKLSNPTELTKLLTAAKSAAFIILNREWTAGPNSEKIKINPESILGLAADKSLYSKMQFNKSSILIVNGKPPSTYLNKFMIPQNVNNSTMEAIPVQAYRSIEEYFKNPLFTAALHSKIESGNYSQGKIDVIQLEYRGPGVPTEETVEREANKLIDKLKTDYGNHRFYVVSKFSPSATYQEMEGKSGISKILSTIGSVFVVPKDNVYGQLNVVSNGETQDIIYALQQQSFSNDLKSMYAFFKLLSGYKKVEILENLFVSGKVVVDNENFLTALGNAMLSDLAQELYYNVKLGKKTNIENFPLLSSLMNKFNLIGENNLTGKSFYYQFIKDFSTKLFVLYRANEAAPSALKKFTSLFVVDESKKNISTVLKSYLESLFKGDVTVDPNSTEDMESYITRTVPALVKEMKVDWTGHILSVLFPQEGESLLFSLEKAAGGGVKSVDTTFLQNAQSHLGDVESAVREAEAQNNLLIQIGLHNKMLENATLENPPKDEALRKMNELVYACITD